MQAKAILMDYNIISFQKLKIDIDKNYIHKKNKLITHYISFNEL